MSDVAALLRHPSTIRERCRNILAAVEEGRSKHFTLHRSQLDEVARRVEQVTRRQYPELRIPYHSRWRHFEAGGVNRRAEIELLLEGRDAAEQAQAHIDLTVMSVLLDAGAGPAWRYDEGGVAYSRSEGLGVATFRAFVAGCFSSDPLDPLRVDAEALLGVKCQQVLSRRRESGHRRLATDAVMWAVPVVEVVPDRQNGFSLFGVGIGAAISPFAQG